MYLNLSLLCCLSSSHTHYGIPRALKYHLGLNWTEVHWTDSRGSVAYVGYWWNVDIRGVKQAWEGQPSQRCKLPCAQLVQLVFYNARPIEWLLVRSPYKKLITRTRIDRLFVPKSTECYRDVNLILYRIDRYVVFCAQSITNGSYHCWLPQEDTFHCLTMGIGDVLEKTIEIGEAETIGRWILSAGTAHKASPSLI